MRNTFADTFYELAKQDRRLAVVVADISPAGSMAKFRQEFPDRFINTGVAEQVMISLAAGMALRGMRTFAYTIATFALFRAFEFVRDDLAYQQLPVTVVGIGGGVAYSTLGATHLAMEDVAVASAVPGMRVMAPCDPAEVREAARFLAVEAEGPTYLRLGKAGEPILTKDAAEPFVPGRLRYLRRGRDTCLLAYGPITADAVAVADRLAAAGESVSVASVHTLQPLDRERIAEALHGHRRVIVWEEHVALGGLGMRVKEIAWDSRATCELRCYALRDKFFHSYGSRDDLLRLHGIDRATVLKDLILAT